VERLYAAIAALPPRQAAVVTLRKLLELDYEEVAELLGISVENCRSHCRLALQRLRAELVARDSSPSSGGMS
jgi:RNA polymerase sigma factor (sigma-70 family)